MEMRCLGVGCVSITIGEATSIKHKNSNECLEECNYVLIPKTFNSWANLSEKARGFVKIKSGTNFRERTSNSLRLKILSMQLHSPVL